MSDLSPKWVKSSHGCANGCVEVAIVDGMIAVCHSKDPYGPMLLFTPAEWEAFLAGVRDGEFRASASPSESIRRST